VAQKLAGRCLPASAGLARAWAGGGLILFGLPGAAHPRRCPALSQAPGPPTYAVCTRPLGRMRATTCTERMENIDLLLDLALTMAAALLGGFIAQRLRQPVILGYLVAGIFVGPYTPGLVTNVERVQTLANFGVALLMFALGVEFSLDALQRVRRVAVQGGILQTLLAMVLGTVLGLVLGYSLTSSIFLGGIIAIASSILMLKLLGARDEMESIQGRIAIGTSIVQDISMVALIVILPALAVGIGPELLGAAGFALLRGGGFLALAYLVGTRVVPPFLARIARAGSRELFILSVVAIAAGMAVLGQFAGVSFALGAFVGGLVVSESDYSSNVLDEVIPIRDVFASLFFVSIGMLMNPGFLVSHLLEVSVLVLGILLGKFAIAVLVVRLFGYPAEVALRTALLLAQIGEFSFVLAGVGLHSGVIDDQLYSIVLAAALLTLILNPLLVNNSDRIVVLVDRVGPLVRRLAPWISEATSPEAESAVAGEATEDQRLAALRRHVIVCGFGRVGQEISRALQRRGFHFVVIDYNPRRVADARRDGYLCIQADATNPGVLMRAGLRNARMIAVTLPDLPSAEQVVRAARSISTRARIVVRTHDARNINYLKQAGAHEVVQPEFEAGLEMVRQALRSFGVSALETQGLLGGRRQEHYGGGTAEQPSSDEGPWS
jgi:CPA2 family monovalent cation:H+ antiporter-2